MRVKKFFVVTRVDFQYQPPPHLPVEIYQVRIDIIEQCALGLQTKRDREPAAKRFNVSPMFVTAPDQFNVIEQPAFSSRPL
jgi:hypothetical protein